MKRRQKSSKGSYIIIKYVSDPSWGDVYIIDDRHPSGIALAVRGIDSLIGYLLRHNIPEDVLEKYYPKIERMSYGETLKIPTKKKG